MPVSVYKELNSPKLHFSAERDNASQGRNEEARTEAQRV
jgi:hypothetical protein